MAIKDKISRTRVATASCGRGKKVVDDSRKGEISKIERTEDQRTEKVGTG